MSIDCAGFPPQIFISYTKRDEDQTSAEVAKSLFRKLTDAGFAVYFDQALLEVGDEWRPELDRALFECDGGVVLISKAALDSGWVKKEATILRSRKAVQEPFEFLPVFVGGAGPADLAGYEWEAVDLSSIQGLQGVTDGEVPDRVVAILEQRFEDWSCQTPDKMRQQLIVVAIAPVDSGQLRYLLTRLPFEHGDWGLAGDPETALARKLASRFANMAPKEVAHFLQRISRWMKKTDAELVIDLAAVYWVPKNLAEQLWKEGESARLRVVVDPKGHELLRLVAVDTDSTDAAQMCVHRASGSMDDWKFVAVGNRVGEDAYEELEGEILEALANDVGIEDDDLEAPYLAMLPLVIAIPRRVAPAVAEKLRKRFRCALLMLCDRSLAAAREAFPPDVLWTFSPLEGAGEAVSDRARAYTILSKHTYKD